MKTMVKLAVLLSTLLLVTGVAYAPFLCDFEECYEVTVTTDPDPVMEPFFAKICLNYGDKIGRVSVCGQQDPLNLSLFFGPLGMQLLGYSENCVQFFKFHGSHKNVVTGIGYCDGLRFTSWAHKTDWQNCICNP